MPHYFIIWTDETIGYIAQHDVTPDEFEEVVRNPVDISSSESSGRPIAFGWTTSGRFLACIYEIVDDDVLIPWTAYEVDPPQ